ncbi:MAG: SAM-dependent methyltransferase, partial [Cyanobacteria bacterium J06598_3]
MTLWALAVSQQQQLSITALAPLFCRWLQHLQGDRLDPAADSLMKTLPSLIPALNWGIVGPTLLAMNLSGYTPNIFTIPAPGTENLGNMINTRTRFFDQALTQYLDTVEQVVILGAGFDTRLFKFCLGQNLALFEVDQPGTQRVKKQGLWESGIGLSEISFVEVNFNQENWIEKLAAAGFEKKKKTFFLWEGVTYYLTETVVKQSLQMMAEGSGEGSAIAFDFFSKDFIQGKNQWWWTKPGLRILEGINEPFHFGINSYNGNQSTLDYLLTGTGFQLHD